MNLLAARTTNEDSHGESKRVSAAAVADGACELRHSRQLMITIE
jgi:hypothetical protein